jgi:short subunit dehydrogenase-like uncharacterized protein
MSDREYDIVLFGATGFTGRLVASYLASRVSTRWAVAGRNRDKLAALGLGVPLVVADAIDPAACAELARRTHVVCTTVGPYSRYGSELVAACADAGTHYCDLAGEVHWMRAMIDAHHARAAQTGARIVHACGFDSIPGDLGTWAAQREFHARFGRFASRVTAFYQLAGGFSGGTYASAFAMAEAMDDPAVRHVLRNPHALDPDPEAARTLAPRPTLGWNDQLRVFTAPFVMADVNVPVVQRSNALAGYPWGRTIAYHEMMAMPGTVRGLAQTVALTGALMGVAAVLKRPRLRALASRRVRQPGDGPSVESRTRGHWKVRFLAEADGDRFAYVAMDRHGDPGYASTSKMLGEAALCLAHDRLTSPGGVLTPAVAMAEPLLARLRAAGLTFEPVPQ